MTFENATLTDPQASTGDELWKAVVSRDARFDGIFLFAVNSAGVYRRPSCPARRPKRLQVLFFSQPEAAERQGSALAAAVSPGGP